MISYTRQIIICDSILKKVKQALAGSMDPHLKQKVNKLPTTDAVLRTVSLMPELRTEEGLRDFITGRILGELNLTEGQKEQLGLGRCEVLPGISPQFQ